MKIKRWISVLLCILLCVCMLPATALAAEDYKVLVGGVSITSDNAADVLGDGGSVTYNPETNTVTLNNATLNGNIYGNTGSALNIVVNGTNTMECTGLVSTGISNFLNNPINISGSGKLTITVQIVQGSAIRGNNVVIDGTELELYTSGEAISGYPLTIQNGAKVTATVTGSNSVAINAGEMKVIGGSTITATSSLGNSIFADSLEIENSTVTGTGYYPMMSWGDITITDSKVIAESTADWGIWSDGNLTIKGKSDVTATGSIAALGAGGSFTLEPPEGERIDVFAGADQDNAPAIGGSPLSQTTDLSSYESQNVKYFHSAPHQHVITLVAKAEPTCTTDGKAAYYACTACGKYFEDEAGNTEITDLENYGVIEAKGHSMTKHEEEPATCTEPGNVAYWQCEACDKTFADEAGQQELASVESPALGHNVVKTEAKAPTATEPGNIEYWHCERCGKYFKDEALTEEIAQEQTVLAATGETAPSKEDPNNGATVPQTGDDGNTVLWAALMLTAGAALAGLAAYSRRRKCSR